MQSDNGAALAGGAGLSVPIWWQYIDPAFQALIAALGFFVLVLTVWNKWLEIKIKRRALQAGGEDEHGETKDS